MTTEEIRKDLEDSVSTTKFNGHPCVWIPLEDTVTYIHNLLTKES